MSSIEEIAQTLNECNKKIDALNTRRKVALQTPSRNVPSFRQRTEELAEEVVELLKDASLKSQLLNSNDPHIQASVQRIETEIYQLEEKCVQDTTPLLRMETPYEIEYNHQLIHERDEEIQKIEEGVHMVHDVFKKIGVLVHDQSQYFDHIEANMSTANINVENAQSELLVAERRTTSQGKCKCWLFLLLFFSCFVFGLVIFIKH